MTLDQMRYFLEAAKFEHVGKAAKSVHISPSAVSSAIASIEANLGCSLFDRQGKSIRLTEQGRFLKTRIEKIFDDISSIETGVRASSAELSGTYRLGGSPFLTTRVLAPVWFSVQKKHPALVGELSSMHTSRLISEVLSGALDFALCFSALQHPELKQVDLLTGHLRLVVRKGHPVLKEKLHSKDFPNFLQRFTRALPGSIFVKTIPSSSNSESSLRSPASSTMTKSPCRISLRLTAGLSYRILF